MTTAPGCTIAVAPATVASDDAKTRLRAAVWAARLLADAREAAALLAKAHALLTRSQLEDAAAQLEHDARRLRALAGLHPIAAGGPQCGTCLGNG